MEAVMSKQDDAWQKGRRAAIAGKPQSDNPHKGGMVYQAWLFGWVEANKERDEVNNA
jgi:ribosome modulation factor